jgi:hypothetical protein
MPSKKWYKRLLYTHGTPIKIMHGVKKYTKNDSILDKKDAIYDFTLL